MKIDIPVDASFEQGVKILSHNFGVSPEEVIKRIFNVNDEVVKEKVVAPTFYQALNIYKSTNKYIEMSEESKKSYDITLRQFGDFLKTNIWKNKNIEEQIVSQIKGPHIYDFLCTFKNGKKKNSKISNNTINRKLATIRAFLDALIHSDKLLGKNAAKEIKFKPEPQQQPDYLTPEEQERAIDLARKGYFGTRNVTIILFMFNTGCRYEGIQNINWNDINFKTKSLILDEKNGKRRKVPLLPQLAEQLLYYRHYYKLIFEQNPSGPVFIKLKGNMAGERITVEAVRSVIKKIYRELGYYDGKLHRTRRTYAITLLQHGVNLVYIKELLGHASISTTIKYLRMNEPEILETMEKHFPLAVINYKKMRELGWDYKIENRSI